MGIMLGIYLFISLILTPFQYRYLSALEEERKRSSDYYEAMPVQEEVLHGNAQGNPLFFLANLFAWLLLKLKKK
ncbi:DUF3949 domain-containing protein [Halobacillus fulvus]|nr:DUF3949 domain-containing protein [Halobacillus fulvus]